MGRHLRRAGGRLVGFGLVARGGLARGIDRGTVGLGRLRRDGRTGVTAGIRPHGELIVGSGDRE